MRVQCTEVCIITMASNTYSPILTIKAPCLQPSGQGALNIPPNPPLNSKPPASGSPYFAPEPCWAGVSYLEPVLPHPEPVAVNLRRNPDRTLRAVSRRRGTLDMAFLEVGGARRPGSLFLTRGFGGSFFTNPKA